MFFAQLGLFIGCVSCASCATLPTPPPPECVYSGVHYQPGETFQPSPCEHCTCTQSGRPMCAIMDCMYPQCADAVHEPDKCCSVCPNRCPTCKHTDGTIIKQGEQYKPNPYTTCECRAPLGYRIYAYCVAQAQTTEPLTHIELGQK